MKRKNAIERAYIPVIIGVTGHRNLIPEQIPKIRCTLRSQLELLMLLCPNSPFVLLSSLAAGADTICAQEALALGMRLVCPLPMAAEEYARDFTPKELEEFDSLLNQAEKKFTVAEHLSRDCLYRAAGEYIVDHCHVLLALWDGDDSLKNGVGTAAVVNYALTHNSRTKSVFVQPHPCGVVHIHVDRLNSKHLSGVSAHTLSPWEDTLKKIEQLNREIGAVPWSC